MKRLLINRDARGDCPRCGTLGALGGEEAGIRAGERRGGGAFTLLELLVVIGIIGILASIGLPALKGLGQANVRAAAHRQLLDDLGIARLHAINGRTPVYVVFMSPELIPHMKQANGLTVAERRQMTNLIPYQYTGYAMIAKRTVGDQPGQDRPRYLGNWKTLPEGYLFAPYKYDIRAQNQPNEISRSWSRVTIPFPNASSLSTITLPCIAFNSQGQLAAQRDEVIALTRGSIFYPKNDDGSYALQALGSGDVVLTPPPKGTNDYQIISVNWLTGRAKAYPPEFK